MHITRLPASGPLHATLLRVVALLVAAASLAAGTARAADDGLESHARIRTAVAEQLAGDGGGALVEVGRLDPRLRLAACDAALEVEPAATSGGSERTVGVRCPGSRPWTVYLNARLTRPEPVAVARQPLPAGTVIEAGHLELAERDVGRLGQGWFADPAALVGRVVTRSLPAGAAVAPAHVKSAVQVRRGDRVTIEGGAGGIAVRMMGEALEPGGLGERIRVRNATSARVVEGVVAADHVIRVSM